MHTSEENLETKTKSQSFLQKKSAGLATRKNYCSGDSKQQNMRTI